MVDKALFSSEHTEWETPQLLFDVMDGLHHFTLDAAATPENTKCKTFITKEQNALTQPWHGRVWVNPPYGQPENPCKPNCEKKRCAKRGWHTDEYIPGTGDWVKKAHEEFYKGNVEVIAMLLPARTDTQWFHTYVWNHYEQQAMPNVTVKFIPGRLFFVGAKNTAPFPSMLVIWEAE